MYHYSTQSSNMLSYNSDNCEFSDAESVVDSLIGHVSPNPSLDNSWSPSPINNNDTWSDPVEFCGMITDAIKNFNQTRGTDFINYNKGSKSQPQQQIPNQPSTMLPYNLTNNNHRDTMSQVFPLDVNQYQGGSVFNTQFTQDLDSYLDSTVNPLNNVEDLKNLSVEELLQDTMDFDAGFNFQTQAQQQQHQQQSALQQSDPNIFNLNRSTMDNKRQEHFLQMIKQQHQDTTSNQSSPPSTPSSDWSDIPSPVSSTGDYEIPINLTKASEEKPAPIKRKRTRRQYSTNTGKPRLYKFLLEILNDPKTYHCIEWVDKASGTFKFLDSSEVARLWGFRKNKPAMKYENFARSLRTYIAKGILKKPRNKLVYCFACPESD